MHEGEADFEEIRNSIQQYMHGSGKYWLKISRMSAMAYI